MQAGLQVLSCHPAYLSGASSRHQEPRDWTEAWVGTMVGDRHRIVRHIASGGMGHVFLARHVSLGGFAAIKILLDADDATAQRCFRTEARIVSRLQHPNIVRVSDCGQLPEGGRYLVMELLAGVDLGTWVAQHGAMGLDRAIHILRQIASAIDYLHGQGVLHRDIKPDNVILHPDANDAVTLFDFGVAMNYRQIQHPSEAGMVVGTPLYMSPEQACGETCGPQADIYSLGALTLELLTGEPPYERLSSQEVLSAVRTRPPRLPSWSGMCIPGLDNVMSRALAREPRKRYASAKHFVEALSEALVDAMPGKEIGSARRNAVATGLADTLRTRSRAQPRAARRAFEPGRWIAVAAWASAAAAWLVTS